ncbi:MAG: hypothetical protein COA63_009245 [Methylophaga sp.]|nr:hypothetical protein [Methylophaga sp.]
MNYYLKQLLLLLLLSPSLASASGGEGMETLVVWVYTIVVVAHGAFSLLLRNLLMYKYLWLVIVSLLFSVAALVLWTMLFTIVKDFMPDDTKLIVASAAGLIIYLTIVIWAIITPIKQYNHIRCNDE